MNSTRADASYHFSGYAQSPWGGGITPGVKWILGLMIAGFIIQMVLERPTGGLFRFFFGLSIPGLRRGLIWQPLTYIFLHGGILHILVNGLALYFIGPETERALGTRRFVLLFLSSGVIGGLGWILISGAGVCVGASGAIFGVLGAFAALYPHRPVTLLVFYVLPVTMKAWILVLMLAIFELALLTSGRGGNVAYAAHLVGIVAGYGYARMLKGRFPGFHTHGVTRAGWIQRLYERKRKNAAVSAAEIDRILDKLAQKGIQHLTARERKLLEEASRQRGTGGVR